MLPFVFYYAEVARDMPTNNYLITTPESKLS